MPVFSAVSCCKPSHLYSGSIQPQLLSHHASVVNKVSFNKRQGQGQRQWQRHTTNVVKCMTIESPKIAAAPTVRKEILAPEPRKEKLSEIWREVQGSNSWEGLLSPTMNPVLKSELLKYGDMVHICYEAFDPDLAQTEHKFGGCRHPKSQLFENSLERWAVKSGYKVTQYLYAETDGKWGKPVKQSVWMGYVAVCDDEEQIRRMGRRDIVIAWRGTMTAKEWVKDFCFSPSKVPSTLPFSVADENIRIESGFLSTYTCYGQDRLCARASLHKEINRLVNIYQDEAYPISITFVGHSLGAALATLAAYDVKESLAELLEGIPVTVFGYGGPKVGNKAFADRVEKVGVKVLRVENKNDFVPKTPGSLPFLAGWKYAHTGVSLTVDNLKSPYLKPRYLFSSWDLVRDAASVHDMGVYLHLVDGHDGEGLPFGKHSRDLMLVNYFNDILRDDLRVGPCWGQQQFCASKDLVI